MERRKKKKKERKRVIEVSKSETIYALSLFFTVKIKYLRETRILGENKREKKNIFFHNFFLFVYYSNMH